MDNNVRIIETIFNELVICCIFYDLKYDKRKRIVILDHEVGNTYKDFQSFDEFKIYFHSLFNEVATTKDEIDRLILEECYENTYFSSLV